ncbi:hypothetical protein SAMN04488030_1509 [Aliiroseovarius halocynthiae]|uniref:O-antigen ligase domain-containing protein n=1 Tax=Aliiroseovarius halocynthiae TaxID=985055 RepID=A0A545SX99_9RHOB|nr:O-antigen ligase domain-containing protein [Aliiroseovarius halocynthiae]TQV69591.1 O-antigen ligase domain-containing protein [Aliiroseovarius halocynthiae]SMR72709.1 hypothetical protein SAMN04488030_1509 [Aliiroseovarius halocynthiae]
MQMNPIERFIFRALAYTWGFYAFGALYVVGPVLGWVIAVFALLCLYLGNAVRQDLRVTGNIPPLIWAWGAGMSVMLVALWIGHLNWDLGTKTLVKSSIGWAKGWALLSLFPLAGALLPIRRQVIIRGQSVVGACTLLLAPLMLAAPYIGLPERIFTSPLKVVGGPGPEYFTVYLFTIDPGSWAPRWQFYAPWSPFAALLGVVSVLMALEEKSMKWRAIGVAAGVLMILASKSRMGMVGLVFCTTLPRLMPLIAKTWAWMALAGITASLAVFGGAIWRVFLDVTAAFRGARADSTRVRDTLQRIAYERWQTEAVWFGHGRVQPGPHLVEYMPIGSHHTWYGLLFVKGVIGFIALLGPFLWHTLFTMYDAARHPQGRLPLGIMLTLILLSFGENIEIEVYLLWPALMILGIHLREVADR